MMQSSPQAFVQLAQQPQALATFAKNAAAFSQLARMPAFSSLISNPSFAAAARSPSFANAIVSAQ